MVCFEWLGFTSQEKHNLFLLPRSYQLCVPPSLLSSWYWSIFGGVKWSECEAGCSPPSSGSCKNVPPLLLCALVAYVYGQFTLTLPLFLYTKYSMSHITLFGTVSVCETFLLSINSILAPWVMVSWYKRRTLSYYDICCSSIRTHISILNLGTVNWRFWSKEFWTKTIWFRKPHQTMQFNHS
jgi:hypothetical protein